MKIYFGVSNSTVISQEFANTEYIELVLADNFLSFLNKYPTQAIYMPFSLLEQWNVTPKLHESQIIYLTEDMQSKFGGASFILTGAAISESEPKTPEYESQFLSQCWVKAMIRHNIESLAIWEGFTHNNLNSELLINSLNSAIIAAN